MRRFKTLKSYTLYTLLVTVFISCNHPKDTVENFCGGVVYEKLSNLAGDRVLTIKTDEKFKKVYVYELEWNKYKVADTINCNQRMDYE